MKPVRRIGVTGHMNLTEATQGLVRAELRKLLESRLDEFKLVGLSCLAAGADSIFAEVIVDLGQDLEVVLPSRNYRSAKVKPDHAPQFDRLVDRATTVETMPFDDAGREAYEAANKHILSSADELIAVWDGQIPVDQGGTGAVVAQARQLNLPTTIVWTAGSSRQ